MGDKLLKKFFGGYFLICFIFCFLFLSVAVLDVILEKDWGGLIKLIIFSSIAVIVFTTFFFFINANEVKECIVEDNKIQLTTRLGKKFSFNKEDLLNYTEYIHMYRCSFKIDNKQKSFRFTKSDFEKLYEHIK